MSYSKCSDCHRTLDVSLLFDIRMAKFNQKFFIKFLKLQHCAGPKINIVGCTSVDFLRS